MSNPVTNIEIEDVLSSIRRLVSEGEKARAQDDRSGQDVALSDSRTAISAPTHGAAVSNPAPQERFVLTPALRVAPAFPEAPFADVSAENDLGDIFAKDRASPHAGTGLAQDPPQDPVEDSREAAFFRRSSLEATIAELEAAVTGQSDEWEPDGSEATPVMDWDAATPSDAVFVSRGFAGLRLVGGSVADGPAQYGHDAGQDDAQSDNGQGDTATLATPEPQPAPYRLSLRAQITAEEDQSAQATERDTAALGFADEDIALASDISRNDAGRYEDDLDPDDDDLTSFLAEEDERGLGEAAMRRIVAEVVRQELQGELGERITRNVRKLVRREIFRVLASQEFD